MQKAKIFKACVWGIGAAMGLGAACAQPVLEQVIEQTKAQKKRQGQSPSSTNAGPAGSAAPPVAVTNPPVVTPPIVVPELWSVSGINERLWAEFWMGDRMARVRLSPGTELGDGWRIADLGANGVLLQKGKRTERVRPVHRGSTGWEYARAPRSTAEASSSSALGLLTPPRAAAANLPMPTGTGVAPN